MRSSFMDNDKLIQDSVARTEAIQQNPAMQEKIKEQIQKDDYENGFVWKNGGLTLNQARAKIEMIKEEEVKEVDEMKLPINRPITSRQAKEKILIALSLWKNSVSCVLSQLDRDMIERVLINRAIYGKSLQEVAMMERKTVEQIVNIESVGKRYLFDAILEAKCRGVLAI